MPSVIKVETLQFFEDRLGKEEGRKVAEVLERAYEKMEKKQKFLPYKKTRIKRRINKRNSNERGYCTIRIHKWNPNF